MRNKIQNYMENKKQAITIMDIFNGLKLNKTEKIKEIEKELEILHKEHIIYKTNKDKFILYKNLSNILTGYISVNKAGNGFLLQDEKDIYVNYNNINYAIDGDFVLVELTKYRGKTEGKVVKVLERKTKNLIGTIKDNKTFELDDKKKKINIKLNNIDYIPAGTKVLVNLTKDLKKNNYIGQVCKVIGHKNDPGVDLKTVALKHEFFDEFSEEAITELEDIKLDISDKERAKRVDLTDLETFTIDGIDTKDIDDAVSLVEDNDKYTLYVHIADVSHYIPKNSKLYEEAYNRGTSLYLADSVIPMIPQKLSNIVCSLNENEDRLAVSVKMEIDKKGNTIKSEIFPSIIKSDKKMNYKDVNLILKKHELEEYKKHKDVILKMNELSKLLKKQKIKDGYIDFAIPEGKLILDENGKCIDIEKRTQGEAEKIIENFMIKTNEEVASYITNMNLPFLYRIHDKPKEEKLKDLVKVLNLMGYNIKGNLKNITPQHLQSIIKNIKEDILHELLLRTMSKAEYNNENIGHFGLGSSNYTHFTSPIRRFSDLTIHYLIRDFIFEKNITPNKVRYYESLLDEIGPHASTREQKSIDAERETFSMKTAELMEDKIDNVYEGVISGVVPFGFFVKLDNLVEGLVHIDTLKNDNYTFVKELHTLKGNKSSYKLGEKVTVKLVRASKELREIDFVLEKVNNGNKK